MDICDANFYLACKVRLWLWKTIPAVQMVFGSFGNILNVIILSRKRMKKIPTSVFLMCLSIADLVTLWTLPLPNILMIVFDVDFRIYSEVLCGSSHMINHAVGGFSIWLLVILSIERMVMTRFPVHARSKLTRRKCMIIVVATLMLTTLFSSHSLFGYRIQMTSVKSSNRTTVQLICHYLPTFSTFYTTTWKYTVFLVYIVIPAALIIVCNATILYSLLQQRRKFAAVTPGEDCQMANRHMTSKEKSTTKLIFVVSACFIFTMLPQTTNRVLQARRKQTDEAGKANRLLLDDSLLILFFCNYSLNFLLYFVSGTLFKQEWKALVADIRSKFRTRVPGHHISTVRVTTVT